MKQNMTRSVLALTGAISLVAVFAQADVKTDQAIAKAEEQFAKGKADEAIKSLVKLATSTPSVEAYLALARLQDLNGNADDAAASVAKAVDASASAPPALKAQALAASAHAALKGGTGKAALDLATKAVAADKNAHSLGTLASAQARLGDAKAAHASADAAIAAGATSSLAQLGKADALATSGQSVEAAAAYRKAIEFDAKNTAARVGLVYALVAAGKGAEAKAEALKATEADKNSGTAFAALGYAISAEKNFSGTDASWSDAIAQAQQGAFLAPKNPQAHVVVAKLFEARGNYDQAQVSYQNAINLDPGFTPAKAAIIRVKFQRGDLEGALKDAGELVKATPESAEANKMYGEFLARKAQATPLNGLAHYKEAIPYLEKATAAMPKSGEAFAILALCYQMTRSFEDGKNAYAKAVELLPADNGIKANYGLLLGMSGDHEKGAQVLSALTTSPGYKSAAGFANYGWVLSRTKPPKAVEAAAAYRRAIDLEPTNAGLHYGLAWAHFYAEDYANAIAEFEKAGTMDKLLLGESRSGVARSEYFKAVKANSNAPDFARTKAAIAASEAAGRPDAWATDAVARYEKAIAEGKQAEAAAAARAAAAAAAGDAVDVGRLSRLLQKGSITQRVEAANDLAAAGADAAEVLGYALETDSIISVREAAVSSLRKMGKGASRALPALNRYLKTEAQVDPRGGAEVIRLEIMESDLRRDIRELIRKLS